jgi:hypothetical protein
MPFSGQNRSELVTEVSRFTTRAAGDTAANSSNTSPQMYRGSAPRGTGPLASSASST